MSKAQIGDVNVAFIFSFPDILLNGPIHLWPSTSIYTSLFMQKPTEIIHAVSDYQRKLYLGLSIFINFKAFYCRAEGYILTLLMSWKRKTTHHDFYCSVSAILMFADSICRFMVRLLCIAALEFVAFFCSHIQKALVKFLENCELSKFCLWVVGEVSAWQSFS